MTKNAQPILDEILPAELLATMPLFDQSHCTEMATDKELSHLIEDEWDNYRDLEKVFKSSFCKKHKFDFSNTLVVDSEAKKLQRCLANAIVSEPYCCEDVDGKPRLYKGEL